MDDYSQEWLQQRVAELQATQFKFDETIHWILETITAQSNGLSDLSFKIWNEIEALRHFADHRMKPTTPPDDDSMRKE